MGSQLMNREGEEAGGGGGQAGGGGQESRREPGQRLPGVGVEVGEFLRVVVIHEL